MLGCWIYDPVSKSFLSRDEYFLENMKEVVRSPVEGNLFSYAKNTPIRLIDPNGSDAVEGSVSVLGVPGMHSFVLVDHPENVEKIILVEFRDPAGASMRSFGKHIKKGLVVGGVKGQLNWSAVAKLEVW